MRVGKTRPKRRHDRYYAGVEHLRDGPRIDARDPPDIAPVRRLGDLLSPEEPVAVEGPRVGAARLQAADDVGIDDVVQSAADDFHRRLVGDAKPPDELRLVAGLLDRLGNRLAAAVDDDKLYPDGVHEREIVHEAFEIVFGLHDGPADLHEDDGPLEILDVRQSLRQDGSFRRGCFKSLHCRILYHISTSLASWILSSKSDILYCMILYHK